MLLKDATVDQLRRELVARMSVPRACEYCGVAFQGLPYRKYCKPSHRTLASHRRTFMRQLGIVEPQK